MQSNPGFSIRVVTSFNDASMLVLVLREPKAAKRGVQKLHATRNALRLMVSEFAETLLLEGEKGVLLLPRTEYVQCLGLCVYLFAVSKEQNAL